jgi:hypothetical protein
MNRRTLPRTLLRGGILAAAVESVAVDQDADGRPDAWGFDADDDGYVEEVALDTTGNALPDSWRTDTDVDTLTTDSGDDGDGDVADSVEPGDVPPVIGVVFTEAGT